MPENDSKLKTWKVGGSLPEIKNINFRGAEYYNYNILILNKLTRQNNVKEVYSYWKSINNI